jgi:hypothetical protein
MLGRKRTIDGRQLVVVEAIKEDGKIRRNGKGIEEIEAYTVAMRAVAVAFALISV